MRAAWQFAVAPRAPADGTFTQLLAHCQYEERSSDSTCKGEELQSHLVPCFRLSSSTAPGNASFICNTLAIGTFSGSMPSAAVG